MPPTRVVVLLPVALLAHAPVPPMVVHALAVAKRRLLGQAVATEQRMLGASEMLQEQPQILEQLAEQLR